ncbi:hypothetical protein EBQ91_00020 [bacterium]|nr:hypothetical protein [bacterium]
MNDNQVSILKRWFIDKKAHIENTENIEIAQSKSTLLSNDIISISEDETPNKRLLKAVNIANNITSKNDLRDRIRLGYKKNKKNNILSKRDKRDAKIDALDDRDSLWKGLE